jgi:aspartate-semialdehyde dehydrogenase
MGYKIAVVGATGNVGREMLQTLYERDFPADEVVALASERSVGREVSFGEREPLSVLSLADYDFTGTDIALFSPGSAVSAEFAPKAAAAGCIVIDNTSQFRMDPDIPLIVPEVNSDAVAGYTNRQPQLFDHAVSRCPEAAARDLRYRARRCRHLPVGLRRWQGRDGRVVQPDPRGLCERPD